MKTVLVLEGTDHDRGFLEALLQDYGYAVTQVRGKVLQVPEVAGDLETFDENIYEKTPLATFRSHLDSKRYAVVPTAVDAFKVSEPSQCVEQHFRGIYEKGPLGIFRTGLDGKLLSMNPAGARMLKYDSPQEMIEVVNRTNIAEACYRDSCHRQKILAEVLRSKDWQLYEEKFRCKDGSVIDCHFHVLAVRDDNGRALELEGFLEDISERKRIERALQFPQFAIDKTIDQNFWSDVNARFIYVNDAACRALGYSRKELLQMSVPEIALIFSVEKFAEHQRELKKKGFLTFETMHRAKDGRVYPVEIRATYVEFDGKEYICAFATDISERKRTEESLWLSQVMIDVASVGIFRSNEDARILSVNDYVACRLGYTPEELCTMTLFDLDPTLTPEFWREHRKKVTAAGFNTFESVHRCKDGSEFPVEVTVNLFKFGDQAFSCSFAKDITERKRSEGLIKASLAEKEVLLREIHHRVKNNLQVVSSLLYLQAQTLSDPELQSHFFESQSRICSMALAHEHLYQSKSLAEVSVRSYVESLAGQLQEVFYISGQKIECRTFIGDIVFHIDKVIPCGLLITEFLSNAYKHAFVDGRNGTITISIEQVGEQFVLSVADDGVGMPAGLDYSQGTTLGLQLVTALVKQHNGTLELEQEGGTLFRVTFANSVAVDN